MIRIGIIDIGIGNTHSLQSALSRNGYLPEFVCTPESMLSQDVIILPGVGAFPFAMEALRAKGFDVALKTWAAANRPLIGICLGMQLLYDTGLEMTATEGLSLLKGVVSPLPPLMKVPHMGWNTLDSCTVSPLTQEIVQQSAVYFVHSFYVANDDSKTHLATCDYGVTIPAIVKSGNIIGFQFHPEKSGLLGQHMLLKLKEVLTW